MSKVARTTLGCEVLLELRPTHVVTNLGHVPLKTPDDQLSLGRPGFQGMPKVEQIPSLPPLIEGPELGAKQLIQIECRDARAAPESPVVHPKGHVHERKLREMLA